jgi:flagellar basal-body rod protein FlgF
MDKSIVTLVSDVQIERIREAHMFHELANVSTLGFKRTFEQFSVNEVGSDTELGPTLVEMKEGPKIYTGNPLDLYLNNDAVMGVINDEGQVNFTRRGDLKVNADNQLVLGSGKLVASDAGDPIVLPPNQIISISEEGRVYALDPAQEVAEQVEVGQIMLRDASNRNLTKLENGLLAVEGLPIGDFETGPEPVSVSIGVVEGSTVSAMEIMVDIMNHMRSFEMKIKLVKDLDELGESNSTLMRMA